MRVPIQAGEAVTKNETEILLVYYILYLFQKMYYLYDVKHVNVSARQPWIQFLI